MRKLGSKIKCWTWGTNKKRKGKWKRKILPTSEPSKFKINLKRDKIRDFRKNNAIKQIIDQKTSNHRQLNSLKTVSTKSKTMRWLTNKILIQTMEIEFHSCQLLFRTQEDGYRTNSSIFLREGCYQLTIIDSCNWKKENSNRKQTKWDN